MKRHITMIIASLLAMLAFATGLHHYYPLQASGEPQLTQNTKPVLWVTSDTHFIAPSLHDNKQAFQWIQGSAAGKDLTDQPIAIKAFVHAAIKARPTAVIITGDVTFNGELASAHSIAKRLAPLEQHGIRLLIIPGNHDIYDGWARKFSGKDQLPVAQISPNDWQSIFHDGYDHAAAKDGNSLSYAVNLNQDYQLLMLDDNIYTVQPSHLAPNTGGKLSAATLQWIQARLVKAQAQGRKTLVFMHHNLYVHSSHAANGWVLNNAASLRKLLAKYQVPVVFSGHIHAQDISADPDGKYATKEIISASFTQTPGIYGVVTLTKDHFRYRTANQNLTPVLKANYHGPLRHYQQHLKTQFIDTQALPIVFQQAKEAGLTGAKLRNATNFLAELNWRFFAGADSKDLASLKQLPGYSAVMHNATLKRHVQDMLEDTNLPDRQLDLNY